MKFFLTATLTALSLAAPAFAADRAPLSPPVTRVVYSDLDLTDEAGAAIMMSRIRDAAVAVCRASPGAGGTSIEAIEAFAACVKQSVSRAVADLNAPVVTAAYQGASASHEVAWTR